jgi:hypothetical protein
VLQQGVKGATDIFQQRMGDLFHDLSTANSFMDDIIVLGYGTFQMHLADVIEVLTRLRSVGMQVNPDKFMRFQTEVTYLGFIITRDGIKPQLEKIQGMLNMVQPKTQKDVCCFVGMINFYHNLYPKCAKALAP